MSLFFLFFVFCDSFLCSISLLLLFDSLSCVLNSVLYSTFRKIVPVLLPLHVLKTV